MRYKLLLASNSLTKMMNALVGGRKGPWAFISANLGHYTPDQAAQKHAELKQLIRSMGFQPQEANGGYQGAPEKSFFVYGMPADDAILLGAEFGQHSVLIGQGGEYRLVSTREQWPEDLVKGRADKDLHVLTPGENNQINQNIAQPEGAQWPIPAFTQLDRRDVPRYPSGDKKRITLDPQFAPENRQASSWVMRNCRFAQESGILPWEYVKNYEPQAMVTYHHPSSMYGDDPGGYVVHVMGRELSGYFRTQEQAWADAAARMQGQQQQRTQSTLP